LGQKQSLPLKKERFMMTIEPSASVKAAAQTLRIKIFGSKFYLGFLEIQNDVLVVRMWNGKQYSKRYPKWQGVAVTWMTGTAPRKFTPTVKSAAWQGCSTLYTESVLQHVEPK